MPDKQHPDNIIVNRPFPFPSSHITHRGACFDDFDNKVISHMDVQWSVLLMMMSRSTMSESLRMNILYGCLWGGFFVYEMGREKGESQ